MKRERAIWEYDERVRDMRVVRGGSWWERMRTPRRNGLDQNQTGAQRITTRRWTKAHESILVCCSLCMIRISQRAHAFSLYAMIRISRTAHVFWCFYAILYTLFIRTFGQLDPQPCVITLQWLSESYETVYDVRCVFAMMHFTFRRRYGIVNCESVLALKREFCWRY